MAPPSAGEATPGVVGGAAGVGVAVDVAGVEDVAAVEVAVDAGDVAVKSGHLPTHRRTLTTGVTPLCAGTGHYLICNSFSQVHVLSACCIPT